jgi:hypothetical protein
MSRLTKDRLTAAEPVLDRYLDKLRRDRFFSAAALERELSDLWRIGYQQVTGVIADLAGHPGYRLVAAYYMENVAADALGPPDAAPRASDVAPEFHVPLAKLYGLPSYDAPDREQKRSEFWRRAFDGSGGAALPAEEYEGPRFTACDEAGNEYVLTPVYRCRTDGAGRPAGGGYEAGDLAMIVSTTGDRVRRDAPGRYTLLDSRTGGETRLTSRDPQAV